MSARLPRLLLALTIGCLGSLGSNPTMAQDKKDEKKDTANAKAVAMANLKKADVGKTTVVETDNFLIGSGLTEEKAKALGATLEKVLPVARKALQFEEKEEPWKGKLTVYYFPDSRDFRSFIRTVVLEQPGGTFYSLRGDEPFIVDPVEAGAKPTEADQFAAAAATIAKAMMRGKVSSASLPEWLVDGFGRVTAARTEGLTSKRYTAYKAAARSAAFGTKGGKPVAIMDLWGESRVPGGDAAANSLAEYMVYGPGSANLSKLLGGFRPNDAGTTPTTPQALESAGWKDVPALEKAWQKWITTGK